MNLSRSLNWRCCSPHLSLMMSSRSSMLLTACLLEALKEAAGHLSLIRLFLTYVSSSQEPSRCSCRLIYSLLQRWAIDSGIGPHYFSIMARCSRFSSVSKKSSPVYSSTKMHAIDHKSDFSFQVWFSSMTSGARYWRVLIIRVCRSCS